MSPTLLEALLLFVGLFSTLSLIGCVDYVYRLARWWHSQRQIPRPVDIGGLRGEVHLLEVRGEAGYEHLGWVRVWPAREGGER